MELLTVDDLANKICDWVGCYGGCTESTDGDGCEKKEIFCCRIGAMLVLPDMIVKAVRNDDFLDKKLSDELLREKMKARQDWLDGLAKQGKRKIDITIRHISTGEYVGQTVASEVGDPGFVIYREKQQDCITAMYRALYDKGFDVGKIEKINW